MFKTFMLIALSVLGASILCAQDRQDVLSGAVVGEKIANLQGQREFDREYMKDSPVKYRPTSFINATTGVAMGSLARYYDYQNYYQGPHSFNYRRKNHFSTDISCIEISNITYADENGDGVLSSGENAQLYFDVINTSEEPFYGLMPVVLSYKTKRIFISDPIRIDTIQGKRALRYVAEICADKSIPNGTAFLKISLHYGQDQNIDIQEICIPTRRKM